MIEVFPLHTLVVDPHDSLTTMTALEKAASMGKGRVLVRPTHLDHKDLYGVAREVLGAMGKRSTLSGTARSGQETWLRAHLWLTAERITDLFLTRAHLLHENILTRFTELGDVTGVRIWFVYQAPELRAGHAEWARAWGIPQESIRRFVRRWPQARAHEEEGPAAALPFPDVPRDEFTSFRASARRLLSAEDFVRVDHLFIDVYRDAAADFAGDPSPELVLARARRECDAGSEFPEVLTRLRALQVAAFHSDVLMRVDLKRARSGWSHRGPSLPITEVARRLRGYADPRRACLGALSASRTFTPSELAGFTVRDGQRAVTGDGYLPDALRPLVTAQVLQREFDGATGAEPLLAGETYRAGERFPMTPKTAQRTLREITRETGMQFAGTALASRHDDDRIWAEKTGISVVVMK